MITGNIAGAESISMIPSKVYSHNAGQLLHPSTQVWRLHGLDHVTYGRSGKLFSAMDNSNSNRCSHTPAECWLLSGLSCNWMCATVAFCHTTVSVIVTCKDDTKHAMKPCSSLGMVDETIFTGKLYRNEQN